MNINNWFKINLEQESITNIITNHYNTIFKTENNNLYLIGYNFMSKDTDIIKSPLLILNIKNYNYNLLNKSLIIWGNSEVKILGKLSNKINNINNYFYNFKFEEVKNIYIQNDDIIFLVENNLYIYNLDNNLKIIKNIKDVFIQNNLYSYTNNDNELYIWGTSEFQRTSFKDLKYKIQNQPKKVNLDKITKVGFFKYHFIVQDNKNELYSWGLNLKGQLGLGFFSKEEYPKTLNIKINIKGISCGLNHSIIYNEYTVYGFGSNKYNQLLNLNEKYINTPTVILNSNNWIKKIISGSNHNYIFLENKDIYSWGDNTYSLVKYEKINKNSVISKINLILNENKKVKENNKKIIVQLWKKIKNDSLMSSQEKIKHLFNIIIKLINEN